MDGILSKIKECADLEVQVKEQRKKLAELMTKEKTLRGELLAMGEPAPQVEKKKGGRAKKTDEPEKPKILTF